MYDAIVVGARCAGSPTAMLLARKGYRVLLVDKATFPSDTISTHYIHPPGVEHLRQWGVLEKVRTSNCPPIPNITVHLDGAAFSPPRADGPGEAFCPRRTVLDKILVDAAVEAGVELREGFSIRQLTMDGGHVTGIRGRLRNGSDIDESARIVIGADGKHSTVARAVRAPTYCEKPALTFAYYTYWSGLRVDDFSIYFGTDRGALVSPTNDALTCVAVGGPIEGFHEFRSDIEGNYLKTLDENFPEVAAFVRQGKREHKFMGTADMPNFFRKPHGPGWALVGDAGYHKDFVTGLGITDAFRDAELLTQAIDDGFSGRFPLDDALHRYEQVRNDIATPLYELTTLLVSGIDITPALMPMFVAFGQSLARC